MGVSVPLHVFVGTKAEYIKTAPLMRLLQEKGIEYRLIDSGQHAEFGKALRARLEVKEPDVHLADRGDVSTLERPSDGRREEGDRLGRVEGPVAGHRRGLSSQVCGQRGDR